MNTDFHYIQELVAKGGPDPADYDGLNAWFAAVHARILQGEQPPGEAQALRAAFGDAMSPMTLQGLVCAHPHGYAGDFEIIDKIYVRHLSPNPKLLRWDAFFHAQPATRAVRSRKGYFHRLLDCHAAARDRLRVLNVASGTGRCTFEWRICSRPWTPTISSGRQRAAGSFPGALPVDQPVGRVEAALAGVRIPVAARRRETVNPRG